MDISIIQKLIQLQALNNVSQLSSSKQDSSNSLFSSLFTNELNNVSSSSSNLNQIINVPQPTLSYGETVVQLLGKNISTAVQPVIDQISNVISPTNSKSDYTKSQFDDIINEMAKKYDVDPKLIHSIIQHESNYNPNATSHAGAKGLMQIMPLNFEAYGITNPYDPKQNIEAGTRMIKANLRQYNGNVELALAAYNAGSGNVKKYGGIPPFKETQNYVRKVTESYFA